MKKIKTTLDKLVIVLAFILIIMGGLLTSYLIVAGTWWVILWSFNFPILFAWKNVIGVILLIFMFGSTASIVVKNVKTYVPGKSKDRRKG